jgi:pimeloyl-ACP methyl ester carboxylesterase
VPVLILSGEMDATTPPDGARAVCTMLGNCRLVAIPSLGHGPFDLDAWQNGDCVDRLAVAFYQAASPGALDTGCVERMVPPPFVIGHRP